MADSEVGVEEKVKTWKRLVKQLRLGSVGRLARGLRRRWSEVRLLQEKIAIVDNPAYGAAAGTYKLVKTTTESDTAGHLAGDEVENEATGRGDELQRALRDIAMRPNSVLMIRGINYHVPGDYGEVEQTTDSPRKDIC